MLYYIILSLTLLFLFSLFRRYVIYEYIDIPIKSELQVNEYLKEDIMQKLKLLGFSLLCLPLLIYLTTYIYNYESIITFNGTEIPKLLWLIICMLVCEYAGSKIIKKRN